MRTWEQNYTPSADAFPAFKSADGEGLATPAVMTVIPEPKKQIDYMKSFTYASVAAGIGFIGADMLKVKNPILKWGMVIGLGAFAYMKANEKK